jgi:tetratricopeptide (TPR) repeat protein
LAPSLPSEVKMGIRAFIVRPFGEKEDRNKVKINFDKVEAELIRPALARMGIQGGTTGEVVRAGNIREDMFQLLLTADLVVADVSIDNANVFYELGIRQALRDKWTVLLRCKADKFPFDLSTDRYLEYNQDDPAASLDALVATLNATINGNVKDSPVFKLLPELQVQDHRRFLPVPPEFREEVERALRDQAIGDLELLAEEARDFQWVGEGLRLVGRALFKLKTYATARRVWEAVRKCFPGDLEADQRLATVYQRLGDLSESDLAVERALQREGLSNSDRAEIRSLRASNIKTRWRKDWEQFSPEEQRRGALRSGFLLQSLQEYEAAFAEDLNHYYSGINALAMNVIQIKLAEAMPEIWEERFDTTDDAMRELQSLRRKKDGLAAGVELSLQAALKRAPDFWVRISEAARVMLTSDRPARVATAYRTALSDADPFICDAERRQLQLYQLLGILQDNVQSALSAFPPPQTPKPSSPVEKKRIILFAGHMLDLPGRPSARFPQEKEPVARKAIRDAIEAERKDAGEIAYGIAGGSHGGDLLFHEVCAELGIETKLWLALPPDQYITVAVQNFVGAGTDKLVERFRQLQRQLTFRCMADELDLPRWLRTKTGYDFWQRHTLWMVYNALTVGTENLTLIALWNEEEGSGTADFVRRVRERGGKVVPVPTKPLFGL